MLRRTALLAAFGLLIPWLAAAPAAAQKSDVAPPTEAQLTAKGAKRLGRDDFAALYVGNTLSGTTSDGDGFHVFVESLEAYRMEYQGKRTADRWSVSKDGEFCTTADKETTCTREYLHEQVIHSFNADSSLAGTARIRPGNPEKL
ncbi:MAG: hypothetical protein ACKVP7_28600 [Hyphomicrobiaceae bacterium]